MAPGWWDHTTLDGEILREAAALTAEDLLQMSRPGFEVRFYDTLEEFYLAEALEYVEARRLSSGDDPKGIRGPIGPTETGVDRALVAEVCDILTGGDQWVVRP